MVVSRRGRLRSILGTPLQATRRALRPSLTRRRQDSRRRRCLRSRLRRGRLRRTLLPRATWQRLRAWRSRLRKGSLAASQRRSKKILNPTRWHSPGSTGHRYTILSIYISENFWAHNGHTRLLYHRRGILLQVAIGIPFDITSDLECAFWAVNK